jgi:hypothetical protein
MMHSILWARAVEKNSRPLHYRRGALFHPNYSNVGL